MKKDKEASLNRKFLEFIKLLNIYLNHFPKHEKYALANTIRNTAYQIYDYITESQKRYRKKTSLTNLDIAHEKMRMQLYLAYELGYFGFRNGKKGDDVQETEMHRFLAISRINDELGKMIGGWIKKVKEQNKW